ncbi:class II aldolase/adducin family protein [Chloroflexota bacterium]
MSRWPDEKREVLEASRKMVDKGLVVGTSGNVSLRLPPVDGREILAITPNRRYYDLMTVDDIQVVDFEVEPVEGDLAPSAETMLHIGIYQVRKNVNAVIHTHSVFASAVAVAGMEIPVILDDQVTFLGGEIKIAEYALPGSEELVEKVVSALGERNAVLLPNHGAVGVGRTMREAFTACELLEKTAWIYVSASTLGKVNTLPDEVIELGKTFFTMLHSGDE